MYMFLYFYLSGIKCVVVVRRMFEFDFLIDKVTKYTTIQKFGVT